MQRSRKNRNGFTMLEIVVSIVLLTVGTLGYAAVTASLARAFYLDARRARAGELVHTQQEVLLRQGCGRISSGSDNRFGMPLQWSAEAASPLGQPFLLVVTRPGSQQIRNDSLSGRAPCI